MGVRRLGDDEPRISGGFQGDPRGGNGRIDVLRLQKETVALGVFENELGGQDSEHVALSLERQVKAVVVPRVLLVDIVVQPVFTHIEGCHGQCP
jgi:hypothetical protein